MRVLLGDLIKMCEYSGGAVPPVHVMKLCEALRGCIGLVADMARYIDAGEVTGPQMDDLETRLVAVKTVEMPWIPS